MNRNAMTAPELMADLAHRGIQLEANGNRLRYAPEWAMTPDLINQLRKHKRALLVALGDDNDGPRCEHCNSPEFTDTPIHGGQSLRRDCAQCGRYHGFPKWYGGRDDEPTAERGGAPPFFDMHVPFNVQSPKRGTTPPEST